MGVHFWTSQASILIIVSTWHHNPPTLSFFYSTDNKLTWSKVTNWSWPLWPLVTFGHELKSRDFRPLKSPFQNFWLSWSITPVTVFYSLLEIWSRQHPHSDYSNTCQSQYRWRAFSFKITYSASRSHTHPSHSQTSHLLSSVPSLGIPSSVPLSVFETFWLLDPPVLAFSLSWHVTSAAAECRENGPGPVWPVTGLSGWVYLWKSFYSYTRFRNLNMSSLSHVCLLLIKKY
jgi:hypothetical protein